MADYSLIIQKITEPNKPNYFILVDSFNTVLGKGYSLDEVYLLLEMFSKEFIKIYKLEISLEGKLANLAKEIPDYNNQPDSDFILETLSKSASSIFEPELPNNKKVNKEIFKIEFPKELKIPAFNEEDIKKLYGEKAYSIDNENMSSEEYRKIHKLFDELEMNYPQNKNHQLNPPSKLN